MSVLVSHSSPRGSPPPKINTPLHALNLSKREGGPDERDTSNVWIFPHQMRQEMMLTRPALFPRGTCLDCQTITLHRLLKRRNGPLERIWADSYQSNMLTTCPMCKMIFHSFHVSKEITGPIRYWLTDCDRPPGTHMNTVNLVRGRDKLTRGSFRIHAEPGT